MSSGLQIAVTNGPRVDVRLRERLVFTSDERALLIAVIRPVRHFLVRCFFWFVFEAFAPLAHSHSVYNRICTFAHRTSSALGSASLQGCAHSLSIPSCLAIPSAQAPHISPQARSVMEGPRGSSS
jgi:hypothetical protein